MLSSFYSHLYCLSFNALFSSEPYCVTWIRAAITSPLSFLFLYLSLTSIVFYTLFSIPPSHCHVLISALLLSMNTHSYLPDCTLPPFPLVLSLSFFFLLLCFLLPLCLIPVYVCVSPGVASPRLVVAHVGDRPGAAHLGGRRAAASLHQRLVRRGWSQRGETIYYNNSYSINVNVSLFVHYPFKPTQLIFMKFSIQVGSRVFFSYRKVHFSNGSSTVSEA